MRGAFGKPLVGTGRRFKRCFVIEQNHGTHRGLKSRDLERIPPTSCALLGFPKTSQPQVFFIAFESRIDVGAASISYELNDVVGISHQHTF